MERHRVLGQDPALITPLEHRRYIITDHVTCNSACRKEDSVLFFIKLTRAISLYP